MAKVTVDAATCVGCGLCEQVCPAVFKVEGDGLAHVIGTGDDASVKDAAEQCPVSAIKIG